MWLVSSKHFVYCLEKKKVMCCLSIRVQLWRLLFISLRTHFRLIPRISKFWQVWMIHLYCILLLCGARFFWCSILLEKLPLKQATTWMYKIHCVANLPEWISLFLTLIPFKCGLLRYIHLNIFLFELTHNLMKEKY